MSKSTLKFGFIFIFLFSFSFLFTASVYSQTPQEAQSWKCLKSQPTGLTEDHPPLVLNFTLTGDGFTTNDPQYIVICAIFRSTKNFLKNFLCSTGNATADQVVFNENMVANLKRSSWKVTHPVPGPQQTPSGGSLSLKGVLNNPMHGYGYNFWAVGFSTPVSTTPGQYEGRESTLQYSTFDFSTASSSGGLSKCAEMRWDPYGRVFDSQSLEPLPDVKIKLLDQNKNLSIKAGLINPSAPTDADGAFNFLVGAGTYYLLPIEPKNYSFSASPNLNPNYIKAYSDIYKPNDQIVEVEGVPQHRDIALDPGKNPPYVAEPELMDIITTQLGDKTEYEGDISHPLTIVTLINETTGAEIARVSADKNGQFDLMVDNNLIPQTDPTKIKLIKVDLRTAIHKFSPLAFLIPDVFAQTTSPTNDTVFNPIFTYLEGYAYNSSKVAIPNAIVRIRMDISPKKIYYQTTADEKGFFIITRNFLPIFPYSLEFVDPKSQSTYTFTTTDFAKSNQTYLDENKLNLVTATKAGKAIYQSKKVSPTTPQRNQRAVSPTLNSGQLASQNYNRMLLIVGIILILIATIVVLVFYMKKGQHSQLPPSSPPAV